MCSSRLTLSISSTLSQMIRPLRSYSILTLRHSSKQLNACSAESHGITSWIRVRTMYSTSRSSPIKQTLVWLHHMVVAPQRLSPSSRAPTWAPRSSPSSRRRQTARTVRSQSWHRRASWSWSCASWLTRRVTIRTRYLLIARCAPNQLMWTTYHRLPIACSTGRNTRRYQSHTSGRSRPCRRRSIDWWTSQSGREAASTDNWIRSWSLKRSRQLSWRLKTLTAWLRRCRSPLRSTCRGLRSSCLSRKKIT